MYYLCGYVLKAREILIMVNLNHAFQSYDQTLTVYLYYAKILLFNH